MSGPLVANTSITITLITGAGAGPFTLAIPAGMADINGADNLVRNLYVRGGFWAPDGNFYPWHQIASISAS